MEYPYTTSYVSPSDLKNLIDYIETTPVEEIPKTFHGERIVGYFIDPVRVHCKRSDEKGKSPYSYWIENRDLIEEQTQDPEKMDYMIFTAVKGCSSFYPYGMFATLNKFKPKSLLDPCAGWGERMLACMLNGIKYTGCDPNTLLQYHYQKILDAFEVNHEKYKVIKSPFEEADLGTETFDMVYTSPPFWDTEIYSSESSQSSSYAGINAWKTNFMYLLLDIAWNRLNPGGVMCIYIQNPPKTLGKNRHSDYVKNTIDLMKSYSDATRIEEEFYLTHPVVYTWRKGVSKFRDILVGIELGPKPNNQQILSAIAKNPKRFAIEKYLKTFSGNLKLHYLAAVKDDVIFELAKAAKQRHEQNKAIGRKIILYMPSHDRNINSINAIYPVVAYKSKYVEEIKALDAKLSDTQEVRLEQGLNNPEFEALYYNEITLIFEMIKQQYPNFEDPERIWVRVNSGVTLRVLARIWKKTIFLCSYGFSVDPEKIKRGVSYDVYRRMIIHINNQQGLSLKEMRKKYGYEKEDLLFE